MDGTIREVAAGLEEAVGRPAPSVDDAPDAAVWRLAGCEVALVGQALPDGALRRAWRERQGGGATPLVVAAPGPDGRLAVVGPRDPGSAPPRLIEPSAFVAAVAAVRDRPAHEAARLLEADLDRSAQAAAPGIVVGGLLTAHFLFVRLGTLPAHRAERDELDRAAAAAAPARGWRRRLEALGYELRPAPDHGYVAVAGGEPVATVHPYPDAEQFSRVDDQGRLPEGALLAACQRAGTPWGMLATGDRLRLFQAATERGAASTRWLDVDAAAIREEHRYVLGLYAPLSLRRGGLLPRLLDAARSFGTGLRDRLDEQVRRAALPAIANGLGRWLQEREGADLMDPAVRREIQDATYTLLFRLLFVLYAESAGSLPYATSAAYRRNALRTLCDDAQDLLPQADEAGTVLWDRWRALVHAIKLGNRAMGVPAYNGSLFAPNALPGAALLERATLSDAAFAAALVALGFDETAAAGAPGLDYAGLDIGHLGGIYEGLLALRLSLADQPYRWDTKAKRFVPGTDPGAAAVAAGELFFQPEAGGRKGAGVYYTRQEFVRHLVRGAVLPALEEHLAQVRELAAQDPEAAAQLLFRFRVLDPAMGSGHFLVDALAVIADRVQTFLAETPLPPVKARLEALRAKSGAGIEEVEDGRLLLRLLLKHCIYGVDLSAMAVELARVSLWLASFVPGLALSYLDHNLQQGDALVGVASFEVLTVPKGKGTRAIPMWASPGGALYQVLERASELALRLADLPDRTPDEVAESEALQAELAAIVAGARRALDLWAAEPFGVAGARAALLNAGAILEGRETGDEAALLARAEGVARRRHVFHWPLAFPEVFHPASERNPGFDAVVGNPPWDEVTVEELGFYALHDPGLRGLPSEAERRRRIAALVARYPAIREEYEARREEVTTQRRFFRPEHGYERQGAGDLDLYELFCERYIALTRAGGRIGVVLPRSAFLAKGNRGFRRWLFGRCTAERLDVLLNNRQWAFPIHPQYTIALLAARVAPPPKGAGVAVSGPAAGLADFQRNVAGPGVRLPLDAIARWTPPPPGDRSGQPTWEVPVVPSEAAVRVLDRLRRGPRFDRWAADHGGLFIVRELDETNDRRYFRHRRGLPVWKGRSFDQYDPHGQGPAGYADWGELLGFLQGKRTAARSGFRGRFPDAVLADPATHPIHRARVAFRDVTNRTNSRTVIACLVPPGTPLTNKAPYLVFPSGDPREEAYVLGVLNSLPFDWQARRYVETNMNYFILDLLCLPPEDPATVAAVADRAARLSCVDGRFAAFAQAAGVDCGPLAADERDRLRAEIDALVARAYGLTDEDLELVFADFTLRAVPEPYRELVRAALREGAA